MAMRAVEFERDAESILREWGAHWRARLGGNAKENLSRLTERPVAPGENAAEAKALKQRFPNLTAQEAREAVKYAPMPRSQSPGSFVPGMPEVEGLVSNACKSVGEEFWERFKKETGWSPQGPHVKRARALQSVSVDGEWFGQIVTETVDAQNPHSDWQGCLMCILGIRFLVRQVYVCEAKVRAWPGSSFDWVYPYAFDASERKSDGREATIKRVKSRL